MQTRYRDPAARALALCVAIAWAAPAAADTVRLSNGDVLTGTVKRFTDGKPVLKTEYSPDEIRIDGTHIVGITTEEPFTVHWEDGSEKVGRLTITGDGAIGVVSGPPTPSAAEVVAAEVSDRAAHGEVEDRPEPQRADAGLPAIPSTERAEAGLPAIPNTERAEAGLPAIPSTERAEAGLPAIPSTERAEAEAAAAAATREAARAAATQGTTPVAAVAGRIQMDELDWIRPIQPYYRYDGRFNLGINLARGNADTTEIHLDGQISPSLGRNTIVLKGRLDRSQASGVTNQSSWRVGAQYDREFGARRRWYAAVFNTYQNNELSDLNLRINAGAGVGYKFLTERPTLLKISVGPAYVNEDFSTAADRTFLGGRWALDFEQDLWTEDLRFYHTDTVTVGLTETQYVVTTVTGIRIALIADLTASAELQVDYLAEPPPDARKLDSRYIFKIGYEFRGDETDWWQ